MRYIPHTESEISEMLSGIGVSSIEELFKSIPTESKVKGDLKLPKALSEQELLKHMDEVSKKNLSVCDFTSFLGAGSYCHHIPAAINQLISRSEWLTPYTPYQPELSQGTLQATFEYQSMICNLTNMEVANASHYDGATSTAEAALMAISKTRKKNIVAASTLHGEYRDTIKTLLKPRAYGYTEVPYAEDGRLNLSALRDAVTEETAGVIVQSPNFFGIIENLSLIFDLVHKAGAFFIVAITEPVSLGLLKGPGEFGADIVTAEGQAFGCGLNFGGPYLGIFASREKYLRSMPGRIVGETRDSDGNRGYVLTMSTREQHIRREKATSNICSNEALLATSSAIYLSLLGKNGLRKLAEINFSNAEYLKNELKKIPKVSIPFSGPTFNEFVIRVDGNTAALNKILLGKDIFMGVPVECWYKNLENHILVCTTECHSKSDLDRFVEVLREELK